MANLDEEKRKWVVTEIESWRRSKLLPEQYCDFLQNIYLDDLNERPQGIVGNAVKKIGQATGKQWFLAFGIFSLICFVVLHFSAFPVALQIGITSAVTLGFLLTGVKLRKRNMLKGTLWLGAGMAIPFVAGLGILNMNGWAGDTEILGLLGGCACIWIVFGLGLRFAALHWLGWMALIVLYSLLLSEHVPDPSGLEVQVFWIPAALLFGWLSWYLHVKFKSTGAVFFATALLLWFMPEVYSAINAVHTNWIQIGIMLKIVLAGVGMFKLRKQWMEWVA
jgi:hypothetical protein